MRNALAAFFALTMLAGPATADPWKNENGKSHERYERGYYNSYNQDREYKQEYRRGNCKIERKWERSGEYKEEIKCKGYR
jgi:hypothetical protein